MNQNQDRIFIGVLLIVIGISALFAAQSIVLSQYHDWSPMFISFGIICIIVGFCVAVIGELLYQIKITMLKNKHLQQNLFVLVLNVIPKFLWMLIFVRIAGMTCLSVANHFMKRCILVCISEKSYIFRKKTFQKKDQMVYITPPA